MVPLSHTEVRFRARNKAFEQEKPAGVAHGELVFVVPVHVTEPVLIVAEVVAFSLYPGTHSQGLTGRGHIGIQYYETLVVQAKLQHSLGVGRMGRYRTVMRKENEYFQTHSRKCEIRDTHNGLLDQCSKCTHRNTVVFKQLIYRTGRHAGHMVSN